MALMVKGFCGSYEAPPTYTWLEYIESTGTQFIDTGFIPNQDTRVDIRYVLPSDENLVIFGEDTGWENKCFTLHRKGGAYNNASTDAYVLYGDDIIEASLNKNVLYKNGEVLHTFTQSTFQADYNLYLFCNNRNGEPQQFISGKVYSCKIYDNDKLVRDFIPALTEYDEIGLFDKVEKKFYKNAGTGTFIGKEFVELPKGYTELEYIQSSGTQYIDTGYKPNNNTRVVTEVEAVDSGADVWLFEGRNAKNVASFGVFINYSKADKQFSSCYGTSEYKHPIAPNGKVKVDANKNVFTIGSDSYTHSTQTFQSNYNLYLFCNNNANTTKGYLKGKIYSCKIYDNETLIRNYVPCQNASGGIGLYDLINDKFYGNNGTGTFIGGETIS